MPYRPAEDAVGLLPDSRKATHCWNDDGALPPALVADVPELTDDVPELSEEVPEPTDEVPELAAVLELAEGALEAAGAW